MFGKHVRFFDGALWRNNGKDGEDRITQRGCSVTAAETKLKKNKVQHSLDFSQTETEKILREK
jgi:hypothetical protein